MQAVTEVAAPKKTKLMLTDLERIVFEKCKQTGDTPQQALETDEDLRDELLTKMPFREERIQARLDQEASWLKHQIAKLKAGVREPQDEPKGAEAISSHLQELAMQKGVDEASELHGAVDD